jgi:hypothetical protein
MVADAAFLSPGLFPGRIDAARRLRIELQVAQQFAAVAQDEAEPRIADQRLAVARHAVGEAAFAIEVEFDHRPSVGRGDAGDRRVFRARRGQVQQGGGGEREHGVAEAHSDAPGRIGRAVARGCAARSPCGDRSAREAGRRHAGRAYVCTPPARAAA